MDSTWTSSMAARSLELGWLYGQRPEETTSCGMMTREELEANSMDSVWRLNVTIHSRYNNNNNNLLLLLLLLMHNYVLFLSVPAVSSVCDCSRFLGHNFYQILTKVGTDLCSLKWENCSDIVKFQQAVPIFSQYFVSNVCIFTLFLDLLGTLVVSLSLRLNLDFLDSERDS